MAVCTVDDIVTQNACVTRAADGAALWTRLLRLVKPVMRTGILIFMRTLYVAIDVAVA